MKLSFLNENNANAAEYVLLHWTDLFYYSYVM